MKTKDIIKAIAKQDGVSPEYVEAEMKKALRQAMSSDDPEAREMWKQISPNGEEPDIDAFLKFCARTMKK